MLIAEAEEAGADPRRLARAARQLARGDGLASSGRHEAAIARYGKAWVTASKALEAAREP